MGTRSPWLGGTVSPQAWVTPHRAQLQGPTEPMLDTTMWAQHCSPGPGCVSPAQGDASGMLVHTWLGQRLCR